MSRNYPKVSRRNVYFLVLLTIFVCIAVRIARFKSELPYVKRVRYISEVEKYIPLHFPRSACIVNGKANIGLSVIIAVKVKIRSSDLNNFTAQPILKRNKIEEYSEILTREMSLVDSEAWDLKNIKHYKAFNGIVLTPETNRSDGLWMIIQDGGKASSDSFLYLYYEG